MIGVATGSLSQSGARLGVLSIMLLAACSDPPETARHDGVDRSLRFDGVDDYVTLPTSGFPTGVEPVTVEMWFKPERTTGTQTLTKVGRGSLSGVQLGLEGANPTAWRVWARTEFAASELALAVGDWRHLAYVFDGAIHELYLDGELVGSGEEYANNRSPTLVWLGALDGTSEFFAGEIDEVRVWALARSQAELSTSGVPPADDTSGVVMHLTFDEVSGARVEDQSPERNDGLLGDGVTSLMPERVTSSREL